jgi:amidase
MALDNILFMSATEIADQIRNKEVTSHEVVSAYLQQIEAQNSIYNAVVLIDKENALCQAKLADKAIENGHHMGKLHGVPITIKDNYLTQGVTTTSGYEPLRNYIPTKDAELVKLLKSEGAIIIGKTNLSVLAMDMQTDNAIFGKTNNAWDVNRTSGGSSGGCAVSLATGMTSLSFGNDLAGSIRLPSAYCGVFGFKPTFGVVSINGIQADPKEPVNGVKSLAVSGPLARSIEDLQLAMDIIAQTTNTDQKVIPINRCSDTFDIKHLKIAWADELGGVPVQNEIKQAIQDYVSKLENSGASVVKITPPIDFNLAWKTWGSIVGMQGGYHTSNFAKWIGLPFTKGVLKDVPMHQNIVKPTSVKKYMEALNIQDSLITQMENFLDSFDAFICPVSVVNAFPHHKPTKKYGNFNIYNNQIEVNKESIHYYMATQAYTIPFTLTENPVLTLPISLSKDSLPIGVQVIGKRYSDFKLLKIGMVLNAYSEKFKYPLA